MAEVCYVRRTTTCNRQYFSFFPFGTAIFNMASKVAVAVARLFFLKIQLRNIIVCSFVRLEIDLYVFNIDHCIFYKTFSNTFSHKVTFKELPYNFKEW